MTYLALTGDVRAFRELEIYNTQAEDALQDWSDMALMHSRITMEADLLDEKHIFISTGLGGHDSLIRFFSFFKSKDGETFSDYQKELIEKEFSFALSPYQGTIEEFSMHENYFTLLYLIDINADIKQVIQRAVDECNTYGNFISNSYVITNVRKYSEEDIRKELNKDE